MTLGTVMQAAAAFIQVQYAFNWIVDNYPRSPNGPLGAARLQLWLRSTASITSRIARSARSAAARDDHAAIRLKDVSVALSDGTVVVDDADVTVELGERVLVQGESGTGKSTLVRAIAGLWPWGEGEITLKRDAKLFLMPQKPYIPLGTLRRATTYPHHAKDFKDKEIAEALKAVGLEHLVEKLDDKEAKWTAPCRAASSSGSPSRACSCTSRTSW
jgi:putative ATP-binding cassette transporter